MGAADNEFMKSLFGMFLVLLFSISAKAESWKVATLEWPPYMCSKCYKNGAAAEALRQTLRKRGITVEFVFYPWVQAQKNGAKRSFVGYFPAYEVLPGFKASAPLFSSPVAFMERKDNPLKWDKLTDLKGKTFGVTEGYNNPKEFKQLLNDGSFKAVTVLNEESIIRKLIAGAVDAVPIDIFVGNYYLNNFFNLEKDKVSISSKILEVKELHFAFNEGSLQKAEVLNTAAQKVNFQQVVLKYLKGTSEKQN